MNPKDMTDTQLNKVIARITKHKSMHPYKEEDKCPNCEDGYLSWSKEDDGWACNECFSLFGKPPDYCNSPEAGAKLKQWLSGRDYYWEMTHYKNKRGTEFADEEYMACVEEKPNGNFSRAYNSRELRAMAEAFAMALEEQSSKMDSS